MKLSPKTFCVAALVLISTTVAALAAPAETRRNAPLYDGPNDNFEVITVIPRDTDVEVTGCSRGWCYVLFEDDEGFVRERLLGFYDEQPPVVVFPQALYQFGWRYWREHNRDDWGRWHERYRRENRPPPRQDNRPPRPPSAQPDRRGPPPSVNPGNPPSRGMPSAPPSSGSRGAPSSPGSPPSRGGSSGARGVPDPRDAPPPPPGGGPPGGGPPRP